jgi:putative ABC transport system ATP-binding protein
MFTANANLQSCSGQYARTMTTPVLEARGLARTYGRGDTRFDALKGVSLRVDQGESLAIVG